MFGGCIYWCCKFKFVVGDWCKCFGKLFKLSVIKLVKLFIRSWIGVVCDWCIYIVKLLVKLWVLVFLVWGVVDWCSGGICILKFELVLKFLLVIKLGVGVVLMLMLFLVCVELVKEFVNWVKVVLGIVLYGFVFVW